MKVARIAALVLLFVLSVCVALALAVIYNQDRILRMGLARVKARTGVDIASSEGRLVFGSHLALVLRHPRLLAGSREIVRAAEFRALISYHSLVFSGGLPFFALLFDHPETSLSSQRVLFPLSAPPRLDADTPKAITDAFRQLSSVTRRVEVIDGALVDNRGSHLIDHLDLRVSRTRRLRPSPWRVKFSFTWNGDPIEGSQLAGDFKFGGIAKQLPRIVAQGRLWVRGVPLDKLAARGVTAGGRMQSDMTIALGGDGRAHGSVSVAVKSLALKSEGPVALGDYSLGAAFDASSSRLEVTDMAVRQGTALILAGDGRVDQPYAHNPRISVLLGGLEADVAALRRLLKSGSFGLPKWLVVLVDRVNSGQVRLDEVALDCTLDELRSMGTPLLRKLSVDARVEGASVALPAEIKLPPLKEIAAQLSYVHGLLVVSQGELRAGHSTVSDFDARADFTRDFEHAPYEIRLEGDADLSEFFPQLVETAEHFRAEPKRWIEGGRGLAGFEVSVKGRLAGLSLTPAVEYAGKLSPRGVELMLRNPPQTVAFVGGNLAFTPEHVKLDHVQLDLKPGATVLDGEVELGRQGLGFHGLAVELQKVAAAKWLPRLFDPGQLAIGGEVDGKVLVNANAADAAKYTVDGKLRIGPGKIQFGFLRSPLIVRSATASFGGRDAVLTIPSATLEGQSIDFKLSVPDLRRPVLRIDSVVQKLDLEAMKFVRLPWSPRTPTGFWGNSKIVGRVEVRQGNLARLPMSNLEADFERDKGNWRVYNLQTTSLGGRLNLELSGRAQDNWIHIKGRVSDMNAGPLFLLSGERRHAPLVGELFADLDLWADTDTDFFDTLAGKASLVVKDGRLERFTLLSRLLGLIDLKNWITANVPDPRATGLPFRFVTGDFAGHDGSFYTENLLLDGPVMDITAEGAVDVGDDNLAMEIGLLPFQTVNWLVNKIPLVGENLAQGRGRIFAAYFRVEGPVGDPRITPEPITSAAEIVKRTLGLPLNLLRPNTVR